jgi:hypothetical protein
MDPFAGSGTTLLAAAEAGHSAFYAEANPFMAWVTTVKTTLTQPILGDSDGIELLREFADEVRSSTGKRKHAGSAISKINESRDYFPSSNLSAIEATKERISAVPACDFRRHSSVEQHDSPNRPPQANNEGPKAS